MLWPAAQGGRVRPHLGSKQDGAVGFDSRSITVLVHVRYDANRFILTIVFSSHLTAGQVPIASAAPNTACR